MHSVNPYFRDSIYFFCLHEKSFMEKFIHIEIFACCNNILLSLNRYIIRDIFILKYYFTINFESENEYYNAQLYILADIN